MASTPILFDYGMSPYSQKIHQFCAAAGITIKSCDQPPLLPRPTLERLEITYRKIPVLAIGKDVYADSSIIIDVLQKNFHSKLLPSPADKAYEVFGDSLFELGLRAFPVESAGASFMKDRETIFPGLRRPDHKKQRPSAVAEIRASFDIVEHQFLGNGKQWINGSQISLSDIHVAWVVKWLLLNIVPGLKGGFPNTEAWIDRLPQKEAEKISDDEAVKLITSSPYFIDATPSIASDPLGLPLGENVSAETVDSTPGSHPQNGKLVGLTVDTVTVQLKNDLRVHFPRRGTIVAKSSL